MFACLLKSNWWYTPMLIHQRSLITSGKRHNRSVFGKGLNRSTCSLCQLHRKGFSSTTVNKGSQPTAETEEDNKAGTQKQTDFMETASVPEITDTVTSCSTEVISTARLSEVTDTTNSVEVTDTTTEVTDTTRLMDVTDKTHHMEMTQKEIEATKQIESFSESEKEKLEMLKAEYWFNSHKHLMPQEMTNSDWLAMMKIDSFNHRLYLYRKLARKEIKKDAKKQRKVKHVLDRPRKFESVGEEKLDAHSDNRNCSEEKLKRRTWQNQYHNQRIKYEDKVKRIAGCRSLMYGSPLVFDLASQRHHMKEACVLANAVRYCYDINIKHPEPFHLHLTGVLDNGYFSESFDKNLFLDVHNEDICDIFPPERLVYLTPHSDTPLQYNTDDIYVLSASTIRRDSRDTLSIDQRKQMGVRSACLPVHSFIRNMLKENKIKVQTVMKILLEFNFTKDWEKAFWHLDKALTAKDHYMWKELTKMDKRVKRQIKTQGF